MSEFALFNKEFFRALQAGELIGSKCLDCSEVSIPQREICPVCHSHEIEIENFSGKGDWWPILSSVFRRSRWPKRVMIARTPIVSGSLNW